MSLLARWLGREEQGEVEAGIGSNHPELPATGDGATASQDRRRRSFEPTRKAMVDTVAKQVLQGWLQNRHQTLLPLTVNFRILPAEDAELLLRIMAMGLLTSSPAGDPERAKAIRFLAGAGATESAVAAFGRALADPVPLHSLFEKARQGHGLGPLAYILLVVVNDGSLSANTLFLQWAAAKLELPTTVIRSVERRYRN